MPGVGIVQLPYRGAPTTVAAIRKVALEAQDHYNVRQLAEAICSQLRGKDYVSEYLAIYYFALGHTRYMRDPRTKELVVAPWRVVDLLMQGKVPQLDCDDVTALIASLLLIAGAQVRILTAAFEDSFYRGERQYSHIFIQAQDPTTKVWITLDPVANVNSTQMLRRAKALKIWPLA